jgi:predicted RND superfamily exporter protein
MSPAAPAGVGPSRSWFGIVAALGLSALLAWVFVRYVDLTPRVDETFFFSSHDPQLREDNEIARLFPESPQLVLAAEGDIASPAYLARIRQMSAEVEAIEGVTTVVSLSHGPRDLDDALKSPIWSRLLLPRDHKSSYVIATVRAGDASSVSSRIETVTARFNRPGFHVMASGVPYVTTLIARNLARDLRVFSLAAVVIFGVVLLVIFRSVWVLAGTLIACIDSGAATLLATHLLRIPIGPVTANLSTMVFVMTLSPIVFLTFNWRHLGDVRQAIHKTIEPSFWSATCMFLGFISLLLVPSTPMRHLGVAGAIGAVMAFGAAYGVYPRFMAVARAASAKAPTRHRLGAFFSRPHPLLVAAIALFCAVGAAGLPKLNTDPDLPSYFQPKSDIRTGLDFVDHASGSSPLNFVIEDDHRAPLNHRDQYDRLWRVQTALERDPAVGTVLSIPLVIGEARRRFLSFLVSTEGILKRLDEAKRGHIASRFITADRTQALFILRMHETDRTEPRERVIARLQATIERQGFHVVLTGGTYSLLDQMGRLVTSSVISGVLILVAIFSAMGYAFSRSLRVAGAMAVSLLVIPVIIRGYIAYLGMPLDFITASAANLDLGMGVDAMIYLTLAARRERATGDDPWTPWSKACAELYRPIGTSLLVLCCGFGIFLSSRFPPTQRFGLFVMLGSATAAATALFMFPWLASVRFGRKPKAAPPTSRP